MQHRRIRLFLEVMNIPTIVSFPPHLKLCNYVILFWDGNDGDGNYISSLFGIKKADYAVLLWLFHS